MASFDSAMAKTDHPHIYEVLEQHGLRVAAMSPFNAKNNTQHPAFFLPDPWTKTEFVGSRNLKAIYQALVQVTDDYANCRIALKSLILVAFVALDHIQWKNLPSYLKETLAYVLQKKTWYRAVVCDRLLADAFLTQWRQHQPDFATLFLNGGAHLQHHYLFSSKVYPGSNENPEWHVPKGNDPLLDILTVYDQILGDLVQAVGVNRLMIATGLHQDPHERTTYYYRLDDQAQFLDRIGIQYVETYRLMTEDFVVVFRDSNAALIAERQLAQVQTIDRDDIFYRETADRAVRTLKTGSAIFHIENRGNDLYLQLKPTCCEFPSGVGVRSGETVVENFDQLISFAQYKNTHHEGTGYYTDNGLDKNALPSRFPLKVIFPMILQNFGIEADEESSTRAAAS